MQVRKAYIFINATVKISSCSGGKSCCKKSSIIDNIRCWAMNVVSLFARDNTFYTG